MVREARVHEALDWLVEAKSSCNRKPEHELHWNKVRRPEQRLGLATALGTQTWGRFVSVVACKDHLPQAAHLNDDGAYLYTLRFLAERLSWFGRQYQGGVSLTLAHKVRFKRAKLLEYDERLRGLEDCRVDWRYLDLKAAKLDQPKRCELLQVADTVTSAIAAAFEPDLSGQAHPEYIDAFHPRIYRGKTGSLTSYGLKMHPWSDATKAAYPWVATL